MAARRVERRSRRRARHRRDIIERRGSGARRSRWRGSGIGGSIARPVRASGREGMHDRRAGERQADRGSEHHVRPGDPAATANDGIEDLPGDDARRPDVSAAIEGGSASLLGGHVRELPFHDAGAGATRSREPWRYRRCANSAPVSRAHAQVEQARTRERGIFCPERRDRWLARQLLGAPSMHSDPSDSPLRARAHFAAWFATLIVTLLLTTAACGGGGACSDELPVAGYADSCEDCEMQGSVLACSCGDGHNGMVATTLDTCSCETADAISNCGGTLQCTDCACIPNGNACGPSGTDVAACCSGHCGDTGTCN